MNDTMTSIYEAMQQRFSARVETYGSELIIYVAPEQYVEGIKALKEDHGFNRLSDITAVDYWPNETPRFHLCVHLHSLTTMERVSIRVPLNGNAPKINSIEQLFTNANWYEREVWDLFGIHFEGHSDLRRIVMPADWQGHPLRKDYPLGYEEVQFSFNFDQINLKKSYAKD